MTSSSAERGQFRIDCIKARLEKGEIESEDAVHEIELFQTHEARMREREAQPEWQINNMEYDLRSTSWILIKARASEGYAQNLYAAMCNNDFQKNEVWPTLQNKTWSCSWRYAGGILADMLGKGDYMDWYCSGISGLVDDTEYAAMTAEAKERYDFYQNNFVSESVVTKEIQEDLFRLGWIVVDNLDE